VTALNGAGSSVEVADTFGDRSDEWRSKKNRTVLQIMPIQTNYSPQDQQTLPGNNSLKQESNSSPMSSRGDG
jgi:hypothetical protein